MKKVFSLLLILLPLTLMTVSCHDEEDPIATTSPYAKYKGSWLGTYSGSDSGTIDFIVNGDGKIIGDVESNGFRSEEHTSELQSRENLVCRLLLEKTKQK